MTLFAWPQRAIVNRVIPKNKLYANAQLSNRLRQAFVSDVDQILWRAKLAPETIQLSATKDVPEIQVFELAMRTREVSLDILTAIDKAIPFPIIFELTCEGRTQMAAAWKRPGPSTDRWTVGNYYTTPWWPADEPRKSLPMALSLGGLYEQLLRALAPYPARWGESLSDHLDRLARIRSLEKEIAKLELQLSREKQFNRKVELNARIRAIRKELQLLTTSGNGQDMSKVLEKTSG